MTSIPSTQAHHPPMSPRDRLQNDLEAAISSGTIAASDETALGSALDAIDEEMRASRPTAGSGGPPDPTEMQQKIADLVDEQVAAGSLTADQGDELKQLFASAAPGGGPGGPGGAGGPPPPDAAGAEAGSLESSSSATDLATLLADFLRQLQGNKGSTTGYGTDGSASTSGATALVLDATA